MRKTFFAVMLIVFMGAAVASAGVSPEDWKRLKAGEILITDVANQNADGSQRVDFLAKLYIKADRQAVWNILRDYEKFPEFMPNITFVKIVRKDGEIFYVYYETKVSVIKARYYLQVDGTQLNKKIVFKLDKSRKNDIRDSAGYWILEDAPDGSGTILSYSTYVDTGIPAPEAIARSAAKKSLPQIVKNMRMRIESGGTWKKPAGS